MSLTLPLEALRAALPVMLKPAAAAWLRQALAEVEADASGAALAGAWGAAGRRLGTTRLGKDNGALTVDEAGRALLLGAALAAAPAERHVAIVSELFRTGDVRERQAVVRALALLRDPGRFAEVAAEATRSNMQSVFEALACDNPYPARHLPEGAFNQLVLKALFVGAPLSRVVGLVGRRTPELARMAEAFASERRAAGRAVPDDIWLVQRAGV